MNVLTLKGPWFLSLHNWRYNDKLACKIEHTQCVSSPLGRQHLTSVILLTRHYRLWAVSLALCRFQCNFNPSWQYDVLGGNYLKCFVSKQLCCSWISVSPQKACTMNLSRLLVDLFIHVTAAQLDWGCVSSAHNVCNLLNCNITINTSKVQLY